MTVKNIKWIWSDIFIYGLEPLPEIMDPNKGALELKKSIKQD